MSIMLFNPIDVLFERHNISHVNVEGIKNGGSSQSVIFKEGHPELSDEVLNTVFDLCDQTMENQGVKDYGCWNGKITHLGYEGLVLTESGMSVFDDHRTAEK